MNKRFRELAAEAYRKVNPGPDVYDEADAAWMGFTDFEREFAELIFRECLEVVEKQFGGGNGDGVEWDRAIDFTYEDMKKHFGVEL